MTETKLVTRAPGDSRAKALLALLAATAALAGGTQALAPASAAAMINDGEECGEPTVDCEPGGGAGGSGGSTGDTVEARRQAGESWGRASGQGVDEALPR